MGSVTCTRCKQEYPPSTEHFPMEPRKKSGLSSWCRNCYRSLAKQKQRKRRGDPVERLKVKQEKKRHLATDKGKKMRKDSQRKNYATTEAYMLKYLYGMTADTYTAMYVRQMGSCAICGKNLPTRTSVHVDHDHRTGIVRGLLCAMCNLGLGTFEDDPVRLARAADYLKEKQ